MALINIPSVPNLWGQPTPDRSASIMMQGMLLDSREQMMRHNIFSKAMKELEPVKFLSDVNKIAQQKRIEGIEKYATALHKKKRGRLSQEDILGIQWEVEKFQEWQAGAQQAMQQVAEAQQAIKQAKQGTYDMPFYTARLQHTIETGEPSADGYLKIAPKDYPATASEVEPPGELVTTKVEKIRTKDGWKEVERTTTELGVLSTDGKSIDVEATEKRKDTIAWSMLNSSPHYKQHASDNFKLLKERYPEMAAEWERKAATYKINAEVQNVQDTVARQQRTYPLEINPAYLYAVDDYKKRMWGSKVEDAEKFEDVGFARLRAEQAEKVKKAPAKLEFEAEGPGNVFYGLFTGFSENDEGDMDSDGSNKVTYRPQKTERVPDIPKGTKFDVGGDTFVISVPEGGGFYSADQGTYATDVSKILNHKLPVVDAKVDYGMPIYSGPDKIAVKVGKGSTFYFKPGQPIGEEQRPLLEQYAEDNQIPLDNLLQEGANDFLRITLQIGSAQGVAGNVTVYQNLRSEAAQDFLSLRERGYQPQNRPESEKVVPEAVAVPETRKKMSFSELWESMKGVFKGKKDEELTLEIAGKTYTVKDLKAAAEPWTDEQIEEAIKEGKIKVK